MLGFIFLIAVLVAIVSLGLIIGGIILEVGKIALVLFLIFKLYDKFVGSKKGGKDNEKSN